MNVLDFTVSWRWTSLVGLSVFFGMVGCSCFLGSMVALPGRRILLKALATCLSVLLGLILADLLAGKAVAGCFWC